MVAKVIIASRARVSAAGNRIAVGSDIHLIEGLLVQLDRANRIIGWMMPYIGSMCPPENGLGDLNDHCFENKVPTPGDETKGAPLNQPRIKEFS